MKPLLAATLSLLVLSACQNTGSPTGTPNPSATPTATALPSPAVSPSGSAPDGAPASPSVPGASGQPPAATPSPGASLPAGLSAIRLSLSVPYLTSIGQTTRLTVTGLDADGNPLSGSLPLSFALSRPQDFSITPDGLITALKEDGFSQLIVKVPGSSLEASTTLSVSSGTGGAGGSSGSRSDSQSLTLEDASGFAGETLSLSGSGFGSDEDATSVTIGGQPVTILSVSRSRIQIIVPNLPGEDQELEVRVGSRSITAEIDINGIYFVNAARPDDSGDGLSWATAKQSLQSALALAGSGDQIWIAEGTYLPTSSTSDRTASFRLVSGVTIYGGFDATSPAATPEGRDLGLDFTILSGDIDGVADVYDTEAGDGLIHTGIAGNSYHVVIGADEAVLDGLTILGGNADGTFPDSNGAGLYAEDSDMTLRNLSFRANSATSGDGGAIYNDASSPVISNASFDYNFAFNGGGAIANSNGSRALVSDAEFNSNRAGNNGGGLFGYDGNDATLAQVRFEGNQAGNNGGAISVFSGALSLSEVQFQGNFAGNNGGGIMNFGSEATLSDVDFEANSAGNGAGAFANFDEAELNEVSFENNSAGNSGGAINNFGTLSLTDGYFLDNTSVLSGGAITQFSGDLSLNETVLDSNGSNEGGAIYFASGTGSLNEVVFSANTAEEDGGALKLSGVSPTLSNVVFSDNTALNDGGALQSENSSPRLVNVSFSRNGSLSGAGYRQTTGTPVLVNTLFWQTSLNGVSLVGSPVTDGDGNQIDTQGNVVAATGVDPFVDSNTAEGPDGDWFSADDGLRLNEDSLILDLGLASFTGVTVPGIDILGVSRPQDADYDPGAYEGGFTVAP